MSWHYLRERGEASSAACCSGGEPSPPSKSIPIADKFYCNGKLTDVYLDSLSGMISTRSTGPSGGGESMWCREGSRARRSALPLEDETQLSTCGPKCCESCGKSAHGSCSQRTCSAIPLSAPQPIFGRLATSCQTPRELPPPAWVRRIVGPGGGWLPTLTAKANAFAPSMAKWPAYRALQASFGPSQGPRFWEMMHGYPIGWTDLRPLATAKFQQWRRWHGVSCEKTHD